MKSYLTSVLTSMPCLSASAVMLTRFVAKLKEAETQHPPEEQEKSTWMVLEPEGELDKQWEG